VVELLDGLHINRAYIVGVSFGAEVAMNVAALYRRAWSG